MSDPIETPVVEVVAPEVVVEAPVAGPIEVVTVLEGELAESGATIKTGIASDGTLEVTIQHG